MKENRREFLKKSGCAALSMTALATQFGHFGLMNAFAQKSISKKAGSVPDDYRALVCIFMVGGNDGNNTIIPLHNDQNLSGYSAYAAARAPQGLALAQKTLLPISVPRIGNLSYGLHPSFGPVVGGTNNGIYELWQQGKLAVVSNVGTLVAPMTRQQYQNGSVPRPYQLFSHTDQTNQHQTCRSDQISLSGWGGRIADKMTYSANPSGLVPTISTLSGAMVFSVGEDTQPVALAPAPTPLSNILTLIGYNGTPIDTARYNAFNAAINLDGEQEVITAANQIHRQALQIGQALNSSQETTATFPNTEIGNQLKQIARMIKARDILHINRQIFFCQIDGFDTHTGQIDGQAILLAELSQAMRAFYDEMTAQGLSDKVTQFTMSDFNRTFNPAGVGVNVGSDHAWANHAFVLGGAVLGGDFYGINTSNGTPFPTLVENGPDDADSGSGARGRWIPTTSVEQYAVTLSRWFGLDEADVPYVFPNLSNFPVTDLGFMMP
jgi:uncharacterized protein (DUF1501 family)